MDAELEVINQFVQVASSASSFASALFLLSMGAFQ